MALMTSFLMLVEDPKLPNQEIPKEFVQKNPIMFNGLPKSIEIHHYKGSLKVDIKQIDKSVCFGDQFTELMFSLKIGPYQRIVFILLEDETGWLLRTPSKKAISTGHRQGLVLYDHKRMFDKLVVSKKKMDSQFQDKLKFGVINFFFDHNHSWDISYKFEKKHYLFGDGWKQLVKDLCFRDGDVLWLNYRNKSTIDLRVYDKNGIPLLFPHLPTIINRKLSYLNHHGEPTVDSPNCHSVVVISHNQVLNPIDNNNDENYNSYVEFHKKIEYLLRLPAEIGRLANLKKERIINIRNLLGIETLFNVKNSGKNEECRFTIIGWRDYVINNQLPLGRSIVFRFYKRDVVLVIAKIH